jgi:glycosyltransferase involved in cell wall biosynthesis
LKKYTPSFYNSVYQKSLKHYLLKNKIEIVLAEYGITASNMVDVCAELSIPLIAHYHGFDAYEYKTIDKYKPAYLNLSNKAAKIIVVSEDMKNELIQLGMNAAKMINHPYGVDVAKFKQTQPAKNKNIIICSDDIVIVLRTSV